MVDDLVLYIVRKITDDPDHVSVRHVNDERGDTVIVSVREDDIGKVIGRNGRIVKALRLVAHACAQKKGQFVHLEVESG